MNTPKYPVLLVHGMGFRDCNRLGYWGKIPKVLEASGCKIYFGHQDRNADIETNGKHLSRRIIQILEETAAEKHFPGNTVRACQTLCTYMNKSFSN